MSQVKNGLGSDNGFSNCRQEVGAHWKMGDGPSRRLGKQGLAL